MKSHDFGGYTCNNNTWSQLISETLTNHNILQYPSSMTVLSLNHCSFDQLKMQNHSLMDWGTNLSFSHKSLVSIIIAHEQNIIGRKTLISRSCGGFSANKKEGKIHGMIIKLKRCSHLCLMAAYILISAISLGTCFIIQLHFVEYK